MLSPFGVEHGEIAKAFNPKNVGALQRAAAGGQNTSFGNMFARGKLQSMQAGKSGARPGNSAFVQGVQGASTRKSAIAGNNIVTSGNARRRRMNQRFPGYSDRGQLP